MISLVQNCNMKVSILWYEEYQKSKIEISDKKKYFYFFLYKVDLITKTVKTTLWIHKRWQTKFVFRKIHRSHLSDMIIYIPARIINTMYEVLPLKVYTYVSIFNEIIYNIIFSNRNISPGNKISQIKLIIFSFWV